MADDAPADLPVSLDEAKRNCRVELDFTDDDAFIGGLILAAVGYVEDHTGLILTPREVVEAAPGFGRWIDLSSWPVRATPAIAYLDRSGATQPVDASVFYGVPGRRPYRLYPKLGGWGVAGCALDAVLPVAITVEAGYASPDDVPATVKQAILLLVASWYENRSAVEAGARAAAVEMPFAVEALLARYRLVSI